MVQGQVSKEDGTKCPDQVAEWYPLPPSQHAV